MGLILLITAFPVAMAVFVTVFITFIEGDYNEATHYDTAY